MLRFLITMYNVYVCICLCAQPSSSSSFSSSIFLFYILRSNMVHSLSDNQSIDQSDSVRAELYYSINLNPTSLLRVRRHKTKPLRMGRSSRNSEFEQNYIIQSI
jgi:hypothetical protein